MYTLSNAQLECQKQIDKYDRCTIIKSIRSGKTLTILDYIKKNNINNVLWVVLYIDNIKGLKEEQEKWNIHSNIKTITYRSLKNENNSNYDLVVLDECHSLTAGYTKSIKNINFNKLIGMTGTYPKNIDKIMFLENELRMTIAFKYTISDAVNDQNVAPFKINCIYKELSKKNDLLVSGKTKTFYTSEFKSYNYHSLQTSLMTGMKLRLAYINMMRFLNTLPSTIEAIKEYINNNKSKRLLIFVATKEMAEKCSTYCYYGGKNDKYYKMFHNKEINHLVLVEKATVGVTYEDLDGCLLTTINSSNSSVYQKIFRTIVWRENYEANIDILINRNTIQQKWIEKALKE